MEGAKGVSARGAGVARAESPRLADCIDRPSEKLQLFQARGNPVDGRATSAPFLEEKQRTSRPDVWPRRRNATERATGEERRAMDMFNRACVE